MATAPLTAQKRQELEDSGARLLFRVSRLPAQEQSDGVKAVRDKALEMRQLRATEEFARFVDRARLIYPDDVPLCILAAQALVDLKMPLAARNVLRAAKGVPPDDKTQSEFQGLLGRVNKQAFVDAPDRSSSEARSALREAINAYNIGLSKAPSEYWHAINLAALYAQPQSGKAEESRKSADTALKVLDAIAGPDRNEWWYATRAEAQLALGREEEFAAALNEFLKRSPSAFALNSLHRQLCELWHLDSPYGPLGSRGVPLISILRAATLESKGLQTVSVPSGAVSSSEPAVDEKALQKTFGDFGPKLWRWWELGLRRARSVVAVCGPDGGGGHRRFGTGFVVSAKSSAGGAPQQFILTNAHVIGDPTRGIAKIGDARVRFEGIENGKDRTVAEIVWTSPVKDLDATLLRLDSLPEGLEALPMSTALPARDRPTQLFVIGYPLGGELAFSFQDNLLLDHDGPPGGQPRRAGVCVLHYRTPTEPGSSGSPVFIEDNWRVVALHHAGTKAMNQLNGKAGIYEANEGIAMSSIAKALSENRSLDLMID